MYRRVNQFTLLALLLAQGAACQALQQQPKNLTISNPWVSTISPEGKFSYSVCPVADAIKGCRAPSDSSILLVLDFKRSVPYIPLEQYLKHFEVADVSITNAGVRDKDLVVYYTSSTTAVVRKSYSHDVYNSGWLKVSNGEQESYLVCPGEISKIGDTDMAASYRCKFQGNLFPLKFLKTSLEEYRNRNIIKQSVMELGNSIDVYSYMGTTPVSATLDNGPKLDSLKVIKASNETKPSLVLVLIYMFGTFFFVLLLKKLLYFIYNKYVNPTRPITPPNNSSTSTLVNELDQIIYAQNNTRPQPEREYALLMEFSQLRTQRAPTAAHQARLQVVEEQLMFYETQSSYVARELARMRILAKRPRRPENSFSDEQIENSRRAAVANTPARTASSLTIDGTPTPRKGRKVYVD